MKSVEVIGLIAGFCTVAAVIPQITKAIKTKEVNDVSPIMFSVLCVGVGLWVVYGVIKNDLAIILTNAISLMLNLMMLILVFFFKKEKIGTIS